MAKIRRTIRKLTPAGPTFDDQYWPVVIALVVLGGFSAGTLLAVFRFDAPGVWLQPWIYLIVLAVLIGLVIWALSYVRNHIVRRGVQLSIVLSIIIHILLVSVSTKVYWTRYLEDLLAAKAPQQQQRKTAVPEYHEWHVDPTHMPKPDHLKPIQTPTRQPEPQSLVQKQISREKPQAPQQPIPVPEPAKTVRPSAVRRPEPVESAPRRSEQQAKLSRRQASILPPQTAHTAPISPANTAAPPIPAEIEAQADSIQQQVTRPPAVRNTAQAEPQTAASHRTQQLARSIAAPTLPQQINQPRSLPRASVADVKFTSPVTIKTSPEALRPPSTLAQEIKPAASSLARWSSTVLPENQPPEPDETSKSAGLSLLAPAPVRNARPASVPIIDPTSRPRKSPGRVARPADLAVSPVAIANPAVADTSRDTSRPQVEPARMALSKSSRGIAGAGRSPNLARDLPTSSGAAQVASASARRERATQADSPGPAISPSAPAQVSRSRAGAKAPSSMLTAQPVQNASTAGSRRPAQFSASASAALTRQNSDAKSGPVTAAKGSVDVDLGPTRIVPHRGVGRAAGGGQPKLNFDTQAHRLPLSRTGSSPSVSLATNAKAETAQAPPDSGGSRPSQPSADPVASAARRSATSGPVSDVSGSSIAVRVTSTVSAIGGPAVGGVAQARGVQHKPDVSPPEYASLPRRAESAGSPSAVAKAELVSLPVGTVSPVKIPEAMAASPLALKSAEPSLAGSGLAAVARRAAGGLTVEIAKPEGPGGLTDLAALDFGTISRRAQSESQQIQPPQTRFIRRHSGGPPAINLSASTATEAFRGRIQRQQDRQRGGGPQHPSPETEEAIERGLRFLALHQAPDGRWSLASTTAASPGITERPVSLNSDTAATGLALLAFLGAGYHHQDHQYKEVVAAAVDYLLKNQKPDGDLYVDQDPESSRSVWLYSHGIAAIALCEAYGMTQDAKLRGPAQKALDFIVAGQHPERGGWRYSPGSGTDTSVTGWLMMALKSGQLAGLNVPDKTFQKIEGWLDRSQASSNKRHLYVYNPHAPDTPQQRRGRRPNQTMTSVGLLMRLYTGWRRDNEQMVRGAEYLLDNLPALGTRGNPRRDTYYWYYATQVMFHMGGRYWDAWNGRLHGLLLDSQVRQGPLAGSWDPHRPLPDRWAAHAGRIYVTTLNLLSLEVYYRHLPIYEETAK